MLTSSSSKVIWLVAIAYLAIFFALASGLINAIIEGAGINRFLVTSRSVQTIGETMVITLVLFIGMMGTFMVYQAGRSPNPKVQKALLLFGFGVLAVDLLLGFIIVDFKL